MNKTQLTLRIPTPLHKSLKKDAKSQGVTLNSYILSSVQRERATRDATLDSVDMNEVAKDISAARDEISALMKEFENIKSIIKDRAYADVEIVRAKDSILSILLDTANKDEISKIMSIEKLRKFIVSRNSLLERYLIPTPDNPITILDDIIIDFEVRRLLKRNETGDIQWGLNVWAAE